MKHRALLAVSLVALALTGCALWPSTWRIGGTPLEKTEHAKQQLAAAQADAIGGAQAAVHQAGIALASAPDSRAVVVARDFVAEAQALIDQARGAPNAAEVQRYREVVAGLLSENAAVRAAAEKQRATDSAANGELAQKLAAAMAKAERADARALEYARDREGLADFAAKLKLGFYLLIGLLVLGTVLSVAARFVPQLGLAAKVINGVVAPGITFAAHRAQRGLQQVGAGMARLRTLATNADDLIERAFDGPIDSDHKAFISAAASAAGNGPKS